MQRFLSAAPDWYITGINGTMGVVMGNLQLFQLGLLQTRHPDVADYSVLPHLVQAPDSNPLKKIIWDEDYSHILGRSIREHQRLRLIEGRVLRQSTCHLAGDLVCHGALIWAADADELRTVRRLTGCIASGGQGNVQYLCGVNADFEPATDLARRVVGFEKTGDGPGVKPPDLFEAFDVHGPGGEVVTELEIPSHPWPGALKVCSMPHVSSMACFAAGSTSMADIHFRRFTPTGAGLVLGVKQACRYGLHGRASRRQRARGL